MEIAVGYLKIVICQNGCICWKTVIGEIPGTIPWKSLEALKTMCTAHFVAKDGAEKVAGPKAAVWQSYLAPSEASWNLMQKFSVLTVGKFWLRNFFKSSAVFCLLVWQALCVRDLCEVPFLCDCSPLSCLHWHLVMRKEEFFHTAKGSSSTKARLISWMFRKGLQLFALTL